ncbi:MAG: DUF362 domain-containing protein [Nanoarchaeota archaeon]|nr:DUF362 domain-containing protein [Nanoarchaeota archaeon]
MDSKYKVSAVKCNSYEPKKLHQALIDSLRNIDFNFKKSRVLIKPNILGPHTPEQALTTNPILIEELCKILKKFNAEIYIGESAGLDTQRSLEISGIKKLSRYAKIINFDYSKTRVFDIGMKGEKILLPEILFDMDLIINLPKLKTHVFTKVTLAVKNLYGCIPGKLKSNLHRIFPDSKSFSRLLVNLENKIKPQLNIIDGVIGIQGDGPGTSGELIKSEIILASRNPYALDIIASEIMGFKAGDIYTNKFSKIKKEDIDVLGNGKGLKLGFKKPRIHYSGLLAPLLAIFPKLKIDFDKNKCNQCLSCELKCPVNAIKIIPNHRCNYKSCIGCSCCIEICPKGAIYLKEHWAEKTVKRIYRYFKNHFK